MLDKDRLDTILFHFKVIFGVCLDNVKVFLVDKLVLLKGI